MDRREFLTVAGAGSAALVGGVVIRAIPRGRDAGAVHGSRRYVNTQSGRIAFVERGSGDAALFLHGFPLNSFQWRGALERLAPYRRCLAPDFLALGYTEVAPSQPVGPDAQVAMLVEFLDVLAVPTLDVVANDSGGAVAQLLIARHPERVRTLLLTNCDTEIDSPPPALLPVIELARRGKFVDDMLAPWLADKRLARSAQGIGGLCYADPTHPTDAAIATYFEPLASSPRRKALADAYAIALERNPLAGIEPALKRSIAPTRIVWGAADSIFSRQSPDYLDRTFGNSRGVRRLEGRKLFWPEELPDVVAEEALRLWDPSSIDQPRR
ncbi:MAG: alpha/beta fold hydrolase [Gemmatimonadota bacterium]